MFPPEIWTRIFACNVDDQPLQPHQYVDNTDDIAPDPYPQDRSHLAAHALICRAASAGVPSILWQYVVLRTSTDVARVSETLEMGLVHDRSRNIRGLVRRLDLRIQGPYDGSQLSRALNKMNRLETLVVDNRVPQGQGMSGTHLVASLPALTGLRRLHLASFNESVTQQELHSICASLPCLEILQIARLFPEGQTTSPSPLRLGSVTTLWIGREARTTWCYLPAGDDILGLLIQHVDPRSAIRRLDLLGDSRHFGRFLQIYGPSLTALHVGTKELLFQNGTLLTLCTNLQALRIRVEDTAVLYPPSAIGHPHLKSVAFIVLPDVVGTNISRHAQDIWLTKIFLAVYVFINHFSALQEIRVDLAQCAFTVPHTTISPVSDTAQERGIHLRVFSPSM